MTCDSWGIQPSIFYSSFAKQNMLSLLLCLLNDIYENNLIIVMGVEEYGEAVQGKAAVIALDFKIYSRKNGESHKLIWKRVARFKFHSIHSEYSDIIHFKLFK